MLAIHNNHALKWVSSCTLGIRTLTRGITAGKELLKALSKAAIQLGAFLSVVLVFSSGGQPLLLEGHYITMEEVILDGFAWVVSLIVTRFFQL